MNTKFSRIDKPKGKFAQSNINLVYRGNASEIQSKPTLRSGGLQLVGKLQGTRRNPPPPPWVPSIKAEMGGQDTKINIVPPGGSGWGTGSSTITTSENSSKSDPKITATASLLEGVAEASEKDNGDSKRSSCTESFHAALVKPPQKPFFALRSSKSVPIKALSDGSSDIGRPLTGKTAGPTIPFYQRPATSSLSDSISPKDPELTEVSINEKPAETKAVSNESTAPRTGWAAVTTEEPDFQERINFSDDEEDLSKTPVVEMSNESPKTSVVSVASWAPTSIQPQVSAQVPYPRTAWDQPNCFNPVSPMQHSFNTSFCAPNEGIFAESAPIAGTRPDVLPSREAALLSEQLQRTSFTTSEAQVQAQREERTLAFKSAVNRAQMARKKRSDAEVMESKRKDQSIDSTKSTLTDVSVFSQSIMQSGTAAIAGTPAFSMHGPVNHSPQHHTMEPPNPKSGHVQGLPPDRPIESSVHSYGNTIGESSVVNHLPFHSVKPHITQHPSSSPVLEKRMESDSNKELVVSSLPRAIAINSRPLQISAHPEGLRTAFTPPAPSTIESFPPQNSQPQLVQKQPHITPLMEVNLSGKWSEKDFDTFPPPVSSRDNYAKFKSSRGGSKNANDERNGGHRYATYNSSGRQNRGPPQRDVVKRSTRRALERDDDRTEELPVDEPVVCDCSEEQQGSSRRRDDIVSGTFPRQQLVWGSTRMSRSNRGALLDYDACKQQNGDFGRQQACSSHNQRDRWKSGSSGCKNNRQGDRAIEKAGSAVSAGSGRGRKSFPRSGPGDRRYSGHEDVAKPRGHHPNQRKIDENPETTNTISQNDVNEVGANAILDSEQGTTPLQLTGSDSQQYHSHRPRRGGSNSGRARRGQHGGSQRQPHRRGRIDRANTRRQINRRHPDEDDDQDFKGGPSNTNVTSTTVATTTTSTGDSNTSRGEGRANTESNGSTTSSGQQQSGSVDAVQSCETSIFVSAAKSRSHAHSITLASDVEVWETASEGFSSSLLGTSPGCSFADFTSVSPAASTAKAADHKDCIAAVDDDYEEGGYSHPPKRTAQRRPTPKITGKIVPLMSINAEAPPSYCDNPSFLDSPLPTVKSSGNDAAPIRSAVEVKDAESVAGSVSISSEDGFMEVRSKSSRRQQKAKLQQKSQKSSISSDERSSTVKIKNRDLVKSRGQTASSRTDQKPSKPFKNDEAPAKDKQRSAPTTVTAASANSSQTSSKHSESAVKKLTNSAMPQPTNAWLKPLQETINEKAAAAAALAAQNSTKSKTALPDSAASSTKATVSTTVSSSYAWSVVVGSRTTATSTSCDPSENAPMSLTAKTNEKVVVPKPVESATSDHPSTVAVAGAPQPLTMPAELELSAIPQSRQSEIEEKMLQDEGATHLPDPSGVSAPSASTAVATSANVCKVRPQKQPTNAVISSSSAAPVSQASKPELTSFPMSTAFSTSGNTVLINTSQLRRPIGDVGDWLGKTSGVYTSNSSSVFFDGYGSKKIETAPDSSLALNPAAAVYLQQQQQQPFRQTLHPLQQQQPMMGFGLPDLTMNGMGTDSYFTVPPFGAGNVNQAGAQQPPRSLYPPAPPAQQRGFPSWQHQQHHSHQEAAVMAAAVAGAVAPQAAALWSSNYTPSPPPHHAPYVGVIGADRPSSTSSVSVTSRLQSGNANASLYGSGPMRGGSGVTPGVGGPPFAQPAPPPPPQAASMPPPSGLYAPSPTHPTPPPPLPFDPNFAYTSGGLANSTSVFSHQSGTAGGPALLAAPQRQSGSARSLGDHPHTSHPPVFINASHAPFPAAPAAIPVHGLAGPPTAPMTTPGLHF
ncbi:hypothetical protein EGR_02522 [Echinococcus granulosus]|uniref:BAT2 N-terminal domain-containing protein n=1 Tax=Echinococcus granulosus TaxID=6210 RepID=W6UPL4_ECHGR|nr:hypothetical protein EGR_02522 [Echinococcus granulosus]EUB62726.1 hypothetical protein EGR_02522 [Echinococcus granulosus]